MEMQFTNGTFDVSLGDVIRCTGRADTAVSPIISNNTEVLWVVDAIWPTGSELPIAAHPVCEDDVNKTNLHSVILGSSITNLTEEEAHEQRYYYFNPSIMEYMDTNPFTESHTHICSYCGIQHDNIDFIDGRYICEDCKPAHTFVCVECGEVHDTRRCMKGMRLCRPCFDNNQDKYARAANDMKVYLKSELVEVEHQLITREYAEEVSIVCSVCGKRHYTWNMIKIGKKTLCNTCADEHYPVCPSCHRRHIKRNCTMTVDGLVCSRCMASKYKRCEICGVWENVLKLIIPEDSPKVYCRNCANSLHVCNDCGRRYVNFSELSSFVVEGNWAGNVRNVCKRCESGYVKCEDCDTYIRRSRASLAPDGKWYCHLHISEHFVKCSWCGKWKTSNALTHGPDDNKICDDCFTFAAHGTNGGQDGSVFGHVPPSGVTNYSYKPTSIFYPNKNTNGLYLGVELEVDGGHNPNTTADHVNNILGITYAKHDGSLGSYGIEFVSHPATIDYFNEHKDRFATAMKYLRRRGYSSHSANTCGLHVHVSSFPLIYETDNGIEKLLYLQNKFWENLFLFSRRDITTANRWAKKIPLERNAASNDVYFNVRIAALKKAKNSAKNNGRYQCINLQNRNTVEFRLMRGTLNIDTFMATLQLISNLCELVMTKTMDEVCALTWDDIVSYHNYTELKEYWTSRSLDLAKRKEYDADNVSLESTDEHLEEIGLAFAA